MDEEQLEIKALPIFGEKQIIYYFVDGKKDKQFFVNEVKRIFGVNIDINKVEHTWGKDKKYLGTYLLEKCKKSDSDYPMTYIKV
jgi:hypothetical protein